jgi:hypothetical protein
MTDAKEVGVGNPAEENTFCHRTMTRLFPPIMADKGFVFFALKTSHRMGLYTRFYGTFTLGTSLALW